MVLPSHSQCLLCFLGVLLFISIQVYVLISDVTIIQLRSSPPHHTNQKMSNPEPNEFILHSLFISYQPFPHFKKIKILLNNAECHWVPKTFPPSSHQASPSLPSSNLPRTFLQPSSHLPPTFLEPSSNLPPTFLRTFLPPSSDSSSNLSRNLS